MTKRDLITEAIEQLIDKQIIADDDRNDAIRIVLSVFVGFSIFADPYRLRDE